MPIEFSKTSAHDKSSEYPTVTIITSTLNCVTSLEKTIQSIREQTYKNIQWIVADGASVDGTLYLIKSNSDVIGKWFSETDRGIYDAWNKACEFIHGEWVIFLGAGDVFCESTTLESVIPVLSEINSDVVIVYGNVIQEKDGEETYRYGEVNLDKWEIYRPKLPAHQGVFQKTSLFKIDSFDASYQVVADSKFMLSALKKGMAKYVDVDVCLMEPGGVSSNPKYAVKVMREFLRLENELGYQIPWFKKSLYVAKSFIKRVNFYIASHIRSLLIRFYFIK